MKNPKVTSEVIRPNFGQHTPAIEELLKLLSTAKRSREFSLKNVESYRTSLQEAEQQLTDTERKIESYENAIRALGGCIPSTAPEHLHSA
jgi:hypothetical protein